MEGEISINYKRCPSLSFLSFFTSFFTFSTLCSHLQEKVVQLQHLRRCLHIGLRRETNLLRQALRHLPCQPWWPRRGETCARRVCGTKQAKKTLHSLSLLSLLSLSLYFSLSISLSIYLYVSLFSLSLSLSRLTLLDVDGLRNNGRGLFLGHCLNIHATAATCNHHGALGDKSEHTTSN